jgi:hypothetical protein
MKSRFGAQAADPVCRALEKLPNVIQGEKIWPPENLTGTRRVKALVKSIR